MKILNKFLLCVLSFSVLCSCASPGVIAKKCPEVDFSKNTKIKVVYENFVYNAEFSFFNNVLKITFSENAGEAFNGVTYEISGQSLVTDVCGIGFLSEIKSLPVKNLFSSFYETVSSFSPENCLYNSETEVYEYRSANNCILTFSFNDSLLSNCELIIK